MLKRTQLFQRLFKRRRAEESFSLRRGLDSIYVFFKLGITSGLRYGLRNDEGDPVGSPSMPVAMRDWS
jgi:hypothetical protein